MDPAADAGGLRTRTSLFCGALALAIAVSILLRGRPKRPQLFFAALAADIGLWYLAQWLYHCGRSDLWARCTAVLAVLLPQFALHLFEAIVPEPERRSTLLRVAGVLGRAHARAGAGRSTATASCAALVFSLRLRADRGGAVVACAARRTQRLARDAAPRALLGADRRAGRGASALADFLWFVGAPLPPVGAVLSIVFLFVLAESLTRERLVDLYDILGPAAGLDRARLRHGAASFTCSWCCSAASTPCTWAPSWPRS